VRRVFLVLALGIALAPLGVSTAFSRPLRTNATYFNNAALPAADPYVLHDGASGFYYAYSTEGADPDWYYAIYRSADLVTWEKLAGGALRQSDPKQWGNDWFWAPEVYRNPRTGLYFLFYAARSDANKMRWFGYADFEEPSKIGVAVSRSPEGPFHNIAGQPIEWYPYDPDYHDVNVIMGPDQKKPPATLAEGQKAPQGTYIPTIDPNVFFARDGHKYLYVSRNAYRNWRWDTDLGKYIEESDIIAVPLDNAWWNDPHGRTMPQIAASYRGASNRPGGPTGPRRDKYVQILSYDQDKQPWENADVNDYTLTAGEKKDRRWEEGSTTFTHTYRDASGRRRTAYYLTYSANNWRPRCTAWDTPSPTARSGRGERRPTTPSSARTRASGCTRLAMATSSARPTAASCTTCITVARRPRTTSVASIPIACASSTGSWTSSASRGSTSISPRVMSAYRQASLPTNCAPARDR